MPTDYPSGASVRQPQSPPTVQTPVDVYSQPLTFSKDTSNEQLAQWLRNHPCLSGVHYEEDISKLIGIMFMYMYLCLHYCIMIMIFLFGCQNQCTCVSGPERKYTNTNNIVRIPTCMPIMYRKVASYLPILRDYHYSNSLQEAVLIPPKLYRIS